MLEESTYLPSQLRFEGEIRLSGRPPVSKEWTGQTGPVGRRKVEDFVQSSLCVIAVSGWMMGREAMMGNGKVGKEYEIGRALPAVMAVLTGSLASGFVAVGFSDQNAQTMRLSALFKERDAFSQLGSEQSF